MKKAAHARFMTGAKKSPRHRLLSAVPFMAPAAPPPPQFAVVPPKLDIWGNATYGDCVSAEEAFTKAWWSVYCGMPELFATEQEVVSFAGRHGWLNGATLTEVMDVMVTQGMSIGGTAYKNGPYKGVDYSDVPLLQSALATGPVKIAIDAGALPNGAGSGQGWWDAGGSPGQYADTDHCVSLGGYGPADYLFDQLKVKLPNGLKAGANGYLLFTWATLGFVDQDWLMSTCTEAWVRNPGTVGQIPPAPTPPLPPVPPSPPSPPVPPPAPVVVVVSDVVSDVVASGPATGYVDGPFGRHAVTLTVALQGTSTPRSATAPAGWHPPTPDDVRIMVGDAIALLQSDPAMTAEKAVLNVVADARAGHYGQALADALSAWPAAVLLIQGVTALAEKWRHSFAASPQGGHMAGGWWADHAGDLAKLLADLLAMLSH